MIRLLGVEIQRDLARRLTRLLVLAFIVLTAVGIGIAWVNIETYSPAEIEARQDQALAQCIADAVTFGVPSGPPATFRVDGGPAVELPTGEVIDQLDEDEARQLCETQLARQIDGDLSNSGPLYYDDPRPNVLDFWDPTANESSFFGGIQWLMMVVGLGAAASIIGAEWKAGTVTTQLTWFPRRVPLFLVKVAAATLLAVVIAFVLQVFFAAMVLALIAVRDGVTDGADATWWGNLFAGIGRGCFLIGVAAALGASLAMLFRNTAGAVILVFAYVAVAEQLLALWQPDWERWFVGHNIAIVLRGHALDTEWVKHPLPAALTLVAYTAIALVAAALTFHRRDIAGTS